MAKTKITGQVYRYDKKVHEGTIVGRDNHSYSFSIKDYLGSGELKEGNIVEFTADGRFAREIGLLTK